MLPTKETLSTKILSPEKLHKNYEVILVLIPIHRIKYPPDAARSWAKVYKGILFFLQKNKAWSQMISLWAADPPLFILIKCLL